VARAVKTPIVGIGGIGTVDDVMEFLVTGASAVQIGTANFYQPDATMRILDALPGALFEFGAARVSDIVGTLQTKQQSPNVEIRMTQEIQISK
jgi:dihydroorotate dehydrogenase (NAD+) catalytic subunit